jgi:hypothetical protein
MTSKVDASSSTLPPAEARSGNATDTGATARASRCSGLFGARPGLLEPT